MDRREFAALLPALLATTTLLPETASAQQPSTPTKPRAPLPEIVSGVYPPGPATGSGGREAHKYLAGMLKAGNIQIEMHETRQEPGTPHEAVGHLLRRRSSLRRQRRRRTLQLLRRHCRPT